MIVYCFKRIELFLFLYFVLFLGGGPTSLVDAQLFRTEK